QQLFRRAYVAGAQSVAEPLCGDRDRVLAGRLSRGSKPAISVARAAAHAGRLDAADAVGPGARRPDVRRGHRAEPGFQPRPAAAPGAQARRRDADHPRAVSVQSDLSLAQRAMIEARDIEIRYGATLVLRGVDFAARTGEMVGLIGANGSGKTSLLRVLANLRA